MKLRCNIQRGFLIISLTQSFRILKYCLGHRYIFKQNFCYAITCDIRKHWEKNGSPRHIGKGNFKKFPENSGFCLGIHKYIPGTFFSFKKLVNWRTYLLHLHGVSERWTKPFHSLIFFYLKCFHHSHWGGTSPVSQNTFTAFSRNAGIQISILSILNWLLYRVRSRNSMGVNCFPSNIFHSIKKSGYSCMNLFMHHLFINLGVWCCDIFVTLSLWYNLSPKRHVSDFTHLW